MADIERLEEIKSRVWKDKGTYAMGDNKSREGYIYTLSDYDYEWLIEQAEKAERYKKALENIVISIFPLDIDDAVAIAKEALEGEE
jgi:hypothetical protein